MILKGITPMKPDITCWSPLDRCLWAIAEDCWNLMPELRPSMEEIGTYLKELSATRHAQTPLEVGRSVIKG